MKQKFKEKAFKPATLQIIDCANIIIDEYAAQGYSLTLRQLYYQFVARDMIENTQREYDRLGTIINNGRLAGLIDWYAIEDRTRNLEALSHWDSASDAIRSMRDQFRIDLWAEQPQRVEVWIEKEALVGVIADTCERLDVGYFACRGYVSQSEQWRAYRRSLDQPLVILHFGDHDPSGIDMSRDNEHRLAQVFGGDVELHRLALNMDQINMYDPPPNPAKVTDSRFAQYQAIHGDQSWELDALEPGVINELIEINVRRFIDKDTWDDAVSVQEDHRQRLSDAMEFVAEGGRP